MKRDFKCLRSGCGARLNSLGSGVEPNAISLGLAILVCHHTKMIQKHQKILIWIKKIKKIKFF
jgi:hypothetical protein